LGMGKRRRKAPPLTPEEKKQVEIEIADALRDLTANRGKGTLFLDPRLAFDVEALLDSGVWRHKSEFLNISKEPAMHAVKLLKGLAYCLEKDDDLNPKFQAIFERVRNETPHYFTRGSARHMLESVLKDSKITKL